MDIKEIQETQIWTLYDKGRNYHRMVGIYTDTDRNYRMYNGDQWGGAKLGDIEPVQKNFIKPIVKYKLAVLHDYLYALNFSSQNHENSAFQMEAERYCRIINLYAHKVWEKNKMDFKLREFTRDSAVNDEGILYVNFDTEKMMPEVEIVKKNDIYYGNENDADIQNQPYILVRKRMPVSNAHDLAKRYGLSEEKLQYIVGDNDTFEESGEASKQEVDNMTTIVYKFFKKDGTVYFSIASRWVDIQEEKNIGITLYPIVHFNWEAKEGSARGEGEVRNLIPNQIEVNKTEMRRVLTVKLQAYPQKVIDSSKIENISAVETVGATIETNGQPVDDVRKVITTLQPAQMSPDVVKLQEDLIQVTRELAGAGEVATGQVNPEQASGRAILAVQQASQSPMTEQKENLKDKIEDFGLICLEYMIAYSKDGIQMEEEIEVENGETQYQMVLIPQSVLRQLQASCKVDVTPRGVYDKFAQEQTIENLLLNGFLTPQRVGELEIYAELLDDDSVAPKMKIKKACELVRADQQKIARMQAQAQLMQQRASQFINEDLEAQASQMAEAQAPQEAPQGDM